MAQLDWYNDVSHQFMQDGYLLPGQKIEDRLDQIRDAATPYMGKQNAQQFIDHVADGHCSLSTPIWANYGTDRGLPASCTGSYMADDTDSIIEADAEIAKMTKMGAGTSCYFGELRPRGAPIKNNGKSFGPVHFASKTQNTVTVISQGGTRRGNCAVWLPVRHPDINEWLDMRNDGHEIKTLSFGVCIDDSWMKEMIGGDAPKREVWLKILRCRDEKGYPYLFFSDNANNNAPEWYRGKHRIWASNLCCETNIPSSEIWSFTCILLSMNIARYEQWKNTDSVALSTMFLDSVAEEFIRKTEGMKYMQRARQFTIDNRALGIGWLGWHSYLQSKMIPFESMEAKRLNVEVAKHIRDKSVSMSMELANRLGEAPVCKGYGRRNATLQAIAPTVSSATILGQVSQSIEPLESNAYIKDQAKLKYTFENPQLRALLQTMDKDTPEVWRAIRMDGGSVRKLDFLTDHQKDVFKTFLEISHMEMFQQAAQRQAYIDQGQSLNTKIPTSVPTKKHSQLLIYGWESGLKSVYYNKSVNAAQEAARAFLDCKSCEA